MNWVIRERVYHGLQDAVGRTGRKGLLERTDGTVINLDWDDRVFRLHNFRIRHLSDDWKRLSLIELYLLIQQADLVLGIDSGVLHCTRFTDTPALGLWTRNQPSAYALPRKESANLIGTWNSQLTRLRRIPFNIIEAPGSQLDGRTVVEQAARMLAPARYLEARGPDVLLQSLLDKLGQDRGKSFAIFLKKLRAKDKPLVLETGCIRAEEDWSAGFATYLFGLFLSHHGGKLISVDLDEKNCNFAKTWTTGLPVQVVHSHSHDYLRAYKGDKFAALYLDSHDRRRDLIKPSNNLSDGLAKRPKDSILNWLR